MEQLIPIINELQDTYTKLHMPFIDLPQIVIIGSQSAGKSSVLENMVRHEFLPRGSGIVTRCPLILHLVHDPESSKGTRGQFLHTGDSIYYDFLDIKNEIMNQTNVLAGPGKNISEQPITLKIYSHQFPTLTLIDLPGLTKVPVESQPVDIDKQIRDTCLKYARKENSIILAISAANVDLANSDSLQFAAELDPDGKRTLCVITKLDLMDKGTDAYDILTGHTLPKELGYIGVVSRSQEDIKKGKPIEESLCDEKDFFEENYPDLARKNGTHFLTNRLNMLLKKHIRKCLPNLKETIKEKIKCANYQIELLGPEVIDKTRLIPQFVTEFTKAYIDINNGNFFDNLKEIRGGALISEIMYIRFPKTLMEIDVEKYLTDDVIMGAIRNTCGTNKMTFSRQEAFICLVREQIQKLQYPSLRCIEDVYEVLKEFVNLASKMFPFFNFPNLIERILHETGNLIRDSYGTTKSLVESIIFSEKVDVMSSHPNYKLGFVLENMNFHSVAARGNNGNSEAVATTLQNDLLEQGFKIICQNIEHHLEDFRRIFIFYVEKSEQIMPIITLLQNNQIAAEDKKPMFDEILVKVFCENPGILTFKDAIINAVLNEQFKVYDALMQHELSLQLKKLTELKMPVNEDNEYAILKNLVIEYFNMVRQNICYFVPKLIQSFMVIRVREKLMYHLQMINNDNHNSKLLQESDTVCKQRLEANALLQDLENVRQRIDDIYCDKL